MTTPSNDGPRAPAPAVSKPLELTIATPIADAIEAAWNAPPAAATAAVTPRRLLNQLSSAQRKEYPITTGVLDYFPDAIALVANVSFKGNQKHNPGQELHWARGKSMDHADCVGRHLLGRDGYDGDILEAAAMAWRALADLQELAERKFNLDPPRGAR